MNWSKLPTFVSVTTVVAFVACVVACSGTTTSSVSGNGQSASGRSSPTEHDIDATIQAEKYVKRFLKYPHDAKFPWSAGSRIGNDTDGYWVTGQVKAKNAFGAELTHEWKVNLTIQNRTWHLVYCEIGDEVVYIDGNTATALEKLATTIENEGAPSSRRIPPPPLRSIGIPDEEQAELPPVPMTSTDELQQEPESPSAPVVPTAPTFRTWTDDTGGYTVEAEFAGYIAGTVKLRKRDGKEVKMPMERLSEEDQAWIRERGK